jgi:hypothetical protein
MLSCPVSIYDRLGRFIYDWIIIRLVFTWDLCPIDYTFTISVFAQFFKKFTCNIFKVFLYGSKVNK